MITRNALDRLFLKLKDEFPNLLVILTNHFMYFPLSWLIRSSTLSLAQESEIDVFGNAEFLGRLQAFFPTNVRKWIAILSWTFYWSYPRFQTFQCILRRLHNSNVHSTVQLQIPLQRRYNGYKYSNQCTDKKFEKCSI